MALINQKDPTTTEQDVSNDVKAEDNKLRPEDRAVHDWYRFVLSYPPHLVQKYLNHFKVNQNQCVLDPFCGTGTTLVECKKNGIPSIGIEANPMACFASEVKVSWDIEPQRLLKHAQMIAKAANNRLSDQVLYTEDALLFSGKDISQAQLLKLPLEQEKLLLKNSISPIPLHKTLVLLDVLEQFKDDVLIKYEHLALAKAMVHGISNLRFGPEVGVGRSREDAPVIKIWLANVIDMVNDLQSFNSKSKAVVHRADSRSIGDILNPCSIDAVITSPPYPNEKDYSRTTRLESVLLGFINNKTELRAVKQDLIRSNTRGVYKSDQDDLLIENHCEIQRIANEIEKRRIELGKTSGFERLYARVTKLYFGGMAKHLSTLRTFLRPGAQLAYVVGDQASYLRIMIRTGELLADIAQNLGYELIGLDLFRTRLSTVTKEQLREEVLLLRWPG